MKGSVHQETIMVVRIYAGNFGAPKYLEKILTETKGEIDGIQ